MSYSCSQIWIVEWYLEWTIWSSESFLLLLTPVLKKTEHIRMKICFIVQLGNTNRVFRHKYGDIGDYKKNRNHFTTHCIKFLGVAPQNSRLILSLFGSFYFLTFHHLPLSVMKWMWWLISFLRGYSLVIVREKCSQWSKSEALPLFLHSVAPGGSGSPPLEENSTYSWHRPFRRKDCTPGEVVVRDPLCG